MEGAAFDPPEKENFRCVPRTTSMKDLTDGVLMNEGISICIFQNTGDSIHKDKTCIREKELKAAPTTNDLIAYCFGLD